MTILVTAASRHNATNGVAQALANTLTRAGLDVVVRRPEEVGHLANYEAVVLDPPSTPAVGCGPPGTSSNGPRPACARCRSGYSRPDRSAIP